MYLKLGDKSIGANNIQRCDTKYSKWRKWQNGKLSLAQREIQSKISPLSNLVQGQHSPSAP